MTARVLFAVLPFCGAWHLLPYTWSCLPGVSAHCWLAPLLQSHSASCVPLVWDWLGTSRQRLALTLRSTPDPDGFPPGPAVMLRLSNWAVWPWLVPMPARPEPRVESLTEPTTVPLTVAVMVLPEKPRARVFQRPVPSPPVVPLRSTVVWLAWLV